MTQRTTTVFEKTAFKRMDALITNPYLDHTKESMTAEKVQNIFGTEPNHSKELLTLWLKNHNPESNYEIITV